MSSATTVELISLRLLLLPLPPGSSLTLVVFLRSEEPPAVGSGEAEDPEATSNGRMPFKSSSASE